MSLADDLILQIKRGNSVPARAVKDVYRWLLRWNVPVTAINAPFYRALYRAWEAYDVAREYTAGKLLFEPMLRSRVHSVGKGLHVTALPYIKGHARITIGDDCRFGYFSVSTGRFCDDPELVFGDNVNVSTGVRFVVNKSIRIGNDVGIAAQCWLADSDGHPTSPEAREAGVSEMTDADMGPLVLEDRVWLGHGAKVLKGVTLGRGSVVAAGSVVAQDVPAGAMAMGVPARILKRPW